MFRNHRFCHSIFPLLVSFLLCLSAHGADKNKDLVAYWPMDEGKGNGVEDASGNGNNGTINGAVEWVEGVVGTALEFDGSSGWVNCGTDDSLYTIKDKCTVMLWFMPTADVEPNDPRQNILYHAGAPMFGFNVFSSSPQLSDIWKREKPGTLVVWVNGPGDPEEFPQTPLTSKQAGWPKDEWHHAAYVYDGAQCRLYMDGKLEDSLDRKGEIGIVAGANLAIGGAGGAARVFKGAVDEVYYYARVLTQAEILSLSGLAVEPADKLTVTWGSIKAHP